MDADRLVAAALWTGLALCLIAATAGVAASRRDHRDQALVLLLFAVLGSLAFSFVSGFSIGRFTVVVPVLLTGYMTALGGGPARVVAALALAAAVYVLMSWLLTPLVSAGGPFEVVFGAWAIPFYAVTALVAFACAWAKARSSAPPLPSPPCGEGDSR